MPRATNTAIKRTKKRTSTQAAGNIGRGPAGLVRTSVYKRVPVTVRNELDKAILLRPSNCRTLEAIAGEFDLADRYGVTPTALRTYAGKLEQVVRPMVASQLMAGVLGCLPESYRQQLLAGSQVLLLSRIVQALTDDKESALPVADLAKLASVLSSVAGRSTAATTGTGRANSKRAKKQIDTDEADTVGSSDPTKMAETVRMLYGLSWPPADETEKSSG